MLIRIGYDVTISSGQETPLICMMTLHDERRGDLRRGDAVILTPEVPSTLYRDGFGNLCRRMVAPAGRFRLWGDAVVADAGLPDEIDLSAQETGVAALPDGVLVYLLGSRYCETDRLSQIAWDLFGHLPPGWGRVQAICDYVHAHIRFNYQTARDTRTAYEAWQEQTGVCRDYAHLAIAFLRCLNIPARYVNGHLSDIGVPAVAFMDFSAWVEVFIGGRWMAFDPRNNTRRIARIKVSHGRDAADVPLIHSFGPHVLQEFKVWCHEVPGIEPDQNH
ncbi:MAG: transglutaminase-like domain-containing protein [Paracoccaceae bacterium]